MIFYITICVSYPNIQIFGADCVRPSFCLLASSIPFHFIFLIFLLFRSFVVVFFHLIIFSPCLHCVFPFHVIIFIIIFAHSIWPTGHFTVTLPQPSRRLCKQPDFELSHLKAGKTNEISIVFRFPFHSSGTWLCSLRAITSGQFNNNNAKNHIWAKMSKITSKIAFTIIFSAK